MIEQVLYRRTIEQGYTEYSSRGVSREDAHSVNILMDTVASEIPDLGSGADAPFMIYPFPEMKKVCIATFQREFSKGRSNSVNHGILISQDEYRELIKTPEKIWGFTYRNFLSKRVNHRNEMFALQSLDTADNPDFNKEDLFQKYHLHNEGFLQFLNALYTSLLKNKNYTCGIEADNSVDANTVMRHFGYLIMSMLPFELREKISFCSRSVPETVRASVQILPENSTVKTDITYNLNSEKCTIHNLYVEITDFYLNDLLDLPETVLKNHFDILENFKNSFRLNENTEEQYVIVKLFKLTRNPELFAAETAEKQMVFLNDVFALPTERTDIINPIVVSLLAYVDPEHHMEVFNINLGLYRKLKGEQGTDKNIIPQIEENLIQNYANATAEEKIRLFRTVFSAAESEGPVFRLLERFLNENKSATDKELLDVYISLYDQLSDTELKTVLYKKITTVIETENDDFRLQILRKYNNASEALENSVWVDTYNAIEDYKKAADDPVFIKCLEEKFYHSVHPEIRNLYLHYLYALPISELEKIIHNVVCKSEKTERDLKLIQALTVCLSKNREIISEDTLRKLISVTSEEGADQLAVYIREVYLSEASENSMAIYRFLESEKKSIYNNPNLKKEELLSFAHYFAMNLNEGILEDHRKLEQILRYLEKLSYSKIVYEKILNMYQRYIDMEFRKPASDYEKYMKYEDIDSGLGYIYQTEFGAAYSKALLARAKACFWNSSDASTFSYDHYNIYRTNSKVYAIEYEEHENHILAENISRWIYNRHVDWDRVYDALLTRKYIARDNVRIQIAKDFMRRYRSENMPINDPEYIAFACVNLNTLKMDYMSLFENLQKFHYTVKKEKISEMRIFRYISDEDQLSKKFAEFKNYQSDTPSYSDIVSGLFLGQILLFLILLADNIAGMYVLKMFEDMHMRNIGLICSYIGYIFAMVCVAAQTVVLMIRANRRKSFLYDCRVFGLLLINLFLNGCAVVLSVKFFGSFIGIIAAAVSAAVMIILTLKSKNKLFNSNRSKKK